MVAFNNGNLRNKHVYSQILPTPKDVGRVFPVLTSSGFHCPITLSLFLLIYPLLHCPRFLMLLIRLLIVPANQNLSKTVCCGAKSYFFFTYRLPSALGFKPILQYTIGLF